MANVLSIMIVVASLLMSVAHAQCTHQPFTWVKWCDRETTAFRDKEGKEAKTEVYVCMTTYRNFDTLLPGAVLVASLDAFGFRVWVRPGVSPFASIRLTVLPKDLWEKVQKNEKIEKNNEAALERFTFNLDLRCHRAVCEAQVNATPEFLTNLKGSGGFIVHVTSESGTVVTSSFALAGFAEALAEEPYDCRELLPARQRIPLKERMRCDEGDWPGCKLRLR
jgi:Invasion associated locus B (IalB) protein